MLTFAANVGHAANSDDYTSGVWRPAGAGDQFRTHDPNGTLIAIGSGNTHSDAMTSGLVGNCFDYAADYIAELVAQIERGDAPGGRIYTATIGLTEHAWKKNEAGYRQGVTDNLQALQPYAADGRIVWASYRQVSEIWKQQYASEPNLYTWEEFYENWTGDTWGG